ncbi:MULTISPECIES: hypothetical protein [Brevibacillus]|uniref:Helix-turn-helix conjugative transposon-like domain-containing protein n=1 Tax=Brevibacillus invocatus TaxID=173959 RepID=A0A3M8BNP5_9BACL|nr:MULTISPECIES: hypothetical protein [Brevibacillus]MDH4618946.1 hypothetical protein [Brevibacillus sp. AY1]RNB65042.1 hypothetical protein EDM52_23905 [Brevibacillus invocatus]
MLEDSAFCELVHDAQQGNPETQEALLKYLQPELEKMTWFIRMSPEDTLQNLHLAVLELITS